MGAGVSFPLLKGSRDPPPPGPTRLLVVPDGIVPVGRALAKEGALGGPVSSARGGGRGEHEHETGERG
jgi:hypothetical protein